MFKILGVDHIGIAVADLKETGSFWTEALGLECTGEEVCREGFADPTDWEVVHPRCLLP